MFLQIPGKILEKDGKEYVILNWSVKGSIYNEDVFYSPEIIKAYKEDKRFLYEEYDGPKIYSDAAKKIGNVEDFNDTGKFVSVKRVKPTRIEHFNQKLKELGLGIGAVAPNQIFVGVDFPLPYDMVQFDSDTELLQIVNERKYKYITEILK